MYESMSKVSLACSTVSHGLSALQKLRRTANADAVCDDKDFNIEFVDESMGAVTDPGSGQDAKDADDKQVAAVEQTTGKPNQASGGCSRWGPPHVRMWNSLAAVSVFVL